MFVWHNIFFSKAINSADTYTAKGGDDAAHKVSAESTLQLHMHKLNIRKKHFFLRTAYFSFVPCLYQAASAELKGSMIFSQLDGGFSTLATAVVDYLGWRLLAQSVAPGVMQQQSNAIVYGISDADKQLQQDPALTTLLEKVAPQLHTRSHKVRMWLSLAWPGLALPGLALPCLALSFLALPCLAWPCLT